MLVTAAYHSSDTDKWGCQSEKKRAKKEFSGRRPFQSQHLSRGSYDVSFSPTPLCLERSNCAAWMSWTERPGTQPKCLEALADDSEARVVTLAIVATVATGRLIWKLKPKLESNKCATPRRVPSPVLSNFASACLRPMASWNHTPHQRCTILLHDTVGGVSLAMLLRRQMPRCRSETDISKEVSKSEGAKSDRFIGKP